MRSTRWSSYLPPTILALVRALRGRKVTVSHGLAETLAQLETEPVDFRDDALRWCDELVSHLVFAEAGSSSRMPG